MITEITKYRTRDGKEFDEQLDAEWHDKALDLAESIQNSDVYLGPNRPEKSAALAEWLMNSYKLEKK